MITPITRLIFVPLLAYFIASCADPKGTYFDIPEGKAIVTLTFYARQSGKEILFNEDQLTDIKTKSIKGYMSADKALESMFKGTRLQFSIETKSGAIAIYFEPKDKQH